MQLRCSQTSELLAEGTPLEIATAAADMDPSDILFDGAGGVDRDGRSTFDHAAVRQQRADELTGLQAALDAMPARAPAGEDPEAYRARRDGLRDTITERRARIAAGKAKVADAKQAMNDARARVEKRRA